MWSYWHAMTMGRAHHQRINDGPFTRLFLDSGRGWLRRRQRRWLFRCAAGRLKARLDNQTTLTDAHDGMTRPVGAN